MECADYIIGIGHSIVDNAVFEDSWRRVCDTTSLSVSVAYRLLGSASHANISGPSTYIGCSKTDSLVSTELNKLASLPLRLIVKETAT